MVGAAVNTSGATIRYAFVVVLAARRNHLARGWGEFAVPMTLLSGLRAVEVSSTPRAGFCGKMLVDAGAEVIKLDCPHPAGGVEFSAWLDRGKASVVIDWRTPEGEALVRRLFSAIDVLVSDRECEGEARELADIARDFPELVHVSTSDLGHDGPFAGRPSTDLTVAALSGICYINGEAGRLPLREPGNQTSIVAGIAAYLGALAALINRNKTHAGQTVEVSALEAMVNVLSPSILQYGYQGSGPSRRSSADGFLFECADGTVSIMTYRQLFWDTILALWGIELDAEDEENLATEQGRSHRLGDIRRVFAPILRNKTRSEVFEELCSARLLCGMLLKPSELPADPHLRERESFDTLATDGAPGRVFPGPAFRIAGHRPGSDRGLPAPGAQTASIVASLTGDVTPNGGALHPEGIGSHLV